MRLIRVWEDAGLLSVCDQRLLSADELPVSNQVCDQRAHRARNRPRHIRREIAAESENNLDKTVGMSLRVEEGTSAETRRQKDM